MRRPRPTRGRATLAAAISLVTGAALVPALVVTPASAASSDLFFSEYVEGSSNNKALELYNGTGETVDLGAGDYAVQVYFNGSSSAGLTVDLAGTVAPGDVFVLAQSNAAAAVLAEADQTGGAGWFNGDDAVALVRGSTTLDVIGSIGVDPGSEWGSGLTSTADNTLRRKLSVTDGDSNGSDAFDPAVEWDGFPVDTFDGLGSHTTGPPVDVPPTVDSTAPADGATDVPRTSDVTVTFSEPVTVGGGAFDLTCSGSPVTLAVSGGPTAYMLDPAEELAFEASCTLTVVADEVTDQDGDPDPLAEDYTASFTVVRDVCIVDTTAIYDIQGSGDVSPLEGERVTTRGVVVADTEGLDGFFLQDARGDRDPTTSDGIFVYLPDANSLSEVDVEVGDAVAVTGSVKEFNTLTELDFVTALQVCGDNRLPTPTVFRLPERTDGDLERVEGMLVRIPGQLTVQQNFFLGRFGQVTLGAGGRLYQPTNQFPAGSPDAEALADANARALLVLDDGTTGQNPNPIPYLGSDGVLRAGDRVNQLVGVIDYGPINSSFPPARDYRLHPTTEPHFVEHNRRTDEPDRVRGELTVASFNVLNYFTTFSGPDARGADDAEEFERQRTKIFAAVAAIDADVVGLVEIENADTTVATTDPLDDLVQGLNAYVGEPGRYAAVPDPATGAGDDAIRVALVYQPDRVGLVGGSLSDNDVAFDNARVPVAQTFERLDDGERISVIVNHFKSKGCGDATGANEDQGDGQGCYNADRVDQAEALLDFVEDVQFASGDEDVFVIGDLNAYAAEDPILVLEEAGLVDLVERFVGDDAYTYVFDGQSGYLDHALATGSLSRQVCDAAVWHINADEPSVIDYNVEFKPQDLYEPTPYRSSDHDPVIVGAYLGRGGRG